MSAVPADEPLASVPMRVVDLGAVLAIEQQAYEFPWTRGNFVDSLAAGHEAWLLRTREGTLGAYCVAMPGVDETHLLNLTVAPAWQGRGLARRLLDELAQRALARGHAALWLEVRPSNAHARRVYERSGFVAVGQRRGYYPAANGAREDALVMKLALPTQANPHALD